MEFQIEEFNYNPISYIDEEEDIERNNKKQLSKMVSYQRRDQVMLQSIAEDCNFMIVNDMFLWKDAFSRYYQNESIGFCPLNRYRPPLATHILKNFGYTVHEESYNGFTTPEEIECICKILESLQIDKAYQVAQFVRQVILPQQINNLQLKNSIQNFYRNDENTIKQILENNFERSLLLAHSFLSSLSENNYRVIKYQIKKFCFDTMSHKIYSNGGSIALGRLIQGDYTFIKSNFKSTLDYLLYYSRNIKLPEILDQRGLIDLNIAMIQGINEIDLTLITLEGFTLQGKARILQYPLSEVTLINGYKACDYLVVVEFIFNPRTLIDLEQKRQEIDKKLLNGSLEYFPNIDSFYSEEKLGKIVQGQEFIKKFYPNSYNKMLQESQQEQLQTDQIIYQCEIQDIQQRISDTESPESNNNNYLNDKDINNNTVVYPIENQNEHEEQDFISQNNIFQIEQYQSPHFSQLFNQQIPEQYLQIEEYFNQPLFEDNYSYFQF